MASVYDDFQTYMKPVLKQNSQKLELLQGGFNGYQLLSDGKGEIFYQQAVQYMRETLGSQGVQTLLGKLKDQEKKTEDAEKQKKNRNNKKTREIFRMQEMGMILPAVLMKAWKILFRSSEESVKWDFLIW